jgi:hypothetical protein
VARWGRRARRALEPLSGIDPAKHPELAEPFDALMALAIAPKKRLPLHVALGILLELDAAVFVRTVRGWRSKMLASPAAAAIGVMAATVDAVIDTEVAIQAATAMVERRLSSEAWRRYFGKVRPFFEEELGKAGSTFAGYLASLRADDDMRLRERIAEAAR